jgi:hypothetical protein
MGSSIDDIIEFDELADTDPRRPRRKENLI